MMMFPWGVDRVNPIGLVVQAEAVLRSHVGGKRGVLKASASYSAPSKTHVAELHASVMAVRSEKWAVVIFLSSGKPKAA